MEYKYGISACDYKFFITSNRHFFSLSQCGFLLCKTGTITVTLFGAQYSLSPNDMMVFHPFVKAEYKDVSQDMHGFIGEVDLANVLLVINQVVNSENLVKMRKNPVVSLLDSQINTLTSHISRYAQALQTSQQNSTPELEILNGTIARNYGNIILLEVLKIYFSNHPTSNTQLSSRDIIFQKFMLDVEQYCTTHRETIFYARRSNLSPKYFSSIISLHSGASPSEWIIQNVVAEAKHLLYDRSLSIKEIAEQFKFPSQAEFTKYFRRYTGMTPTQFRHK